MALTNCRECKNEISSNAKSCPHCGFKSKSTGCFTYLLYIFGFLFIMYLISQFSPSTGSTVIDDTRTYDQSWRSPTDEEFKAISRLMIKNNVSGCGEYHVKEIEPSEFVIACSDGEKWTYFVAWPNIDEINLANEEMISKLKPPY